MDYAPYPFGGLPKLTRAQVHAIGALRALGRGLALEPAMRTASRLLGVAVELLAGLPEAPPPAAPEPEPDMEGLAAWVELEHHPLPDTPQSDRVWIEIPLGLAELLVDRTLGGEGAVGAMPSGQPLDEVSLGALAYLVARVCAALGGGFGVSLIGTRMRAPAGDALVRWPVRARIGPDHGVLQIHAGWSTTGENGRGGRVQGPAVLALGELPLSLRAEAGRVYVGLAELRSLDLGDVLVLDQCSLSYERDRVVGQVSVRVRGGGPLLQCSADTQRLEVESIACTPEIGMSSGRRIAASPEVVPEFSDAEAQTAERSATPRDAMNAINARDAIDARDARGAMDTTDVPIELRLEIAQFQLTLGELQRIAPGDVLVTGRRIGEVVTLRAAGRALAEGELVNVEGEVGVRITRVLLA